MSYFIKKMLFFFDGRKKACYTVIREPVFAGGKRGMSACGTDYVCSPGTFSCAPGAGYEDCGSPYTCACDSISFTACPSDSGCPANTCDNAFTG